MAVAGISGVFGGVLQKDDGYQVQKEFEVCGRDSGYLGTVSQDDCVEDVFVDAGEIGLDVTLHKVRGSRQLAHKLRKPCHGGVGATGCPIRKGVVDKSFVKKGHDVVGEPAVDDSVAKAWRKYLPELGVFDDKTVIPSRPVGSGGESLGQINEQVIDTEDLCFLLNAG